MDRPKLILLWLGTLLWLSWEILCLILAIAVLVVCIWPPVIAMICLLTFLLTADAVRQKLRRKGG